MFRISQGENFGTNPAALKMAKAAAKRVEKKYGRKNLEPWTDFEWRMLNGKMSALNWIGQAMGFFGYMKIFTDAASMRIRHAR